MTKYKKKRFFQKFSYVFPYKIEYRQFEHKSRVLDAELWTCYYVEMSMNPIFRNKLHEFD
ncbi:hypothetical protein LEP1GSC036_0035 [Leptospira weilii str. 2006001853]|uniref:Uncharacterized protein n=1 Tax=Leptospira weilii str. 2006001853 TaxID=1001589 RepID=A0A828YX80_9LEPT|nr:hypothetical protein LEP1GSC036_0035 [Leptospira weilii str. 2006001853]EMN43786.1 hypothetical protein LEP1GSC086_4599 [Leptospira weilii str. LNT 1234]QDK21712.1 hypothetical protein FHG67_02315 [Leptospira weilii]QDK25651.1 hypothetical protein FHG68_02165 [Leptospira weilii]